ncbi:MAG: patatin-like phospholipase family protein [Candidatus Moraniibacteriota bacterium]|nr:MAG: patatin-like phospholipase family protein [Candidatus Moranbacteria bacterium]
MPEKSSSSSPIIGLALGSGGTRGLAHIGVLKILEENNIPIHCIAGSSIGSMIGGYYASGLSVSEIESLASGTNWRKLLSVLFDPNLRHGLLNGGKVESFLNDTLKEKTIEKCRIPFTAVATDLKTGECVLLNKGAMASAIKASMSIPLVFKPTEKEGKILADGGLSSPVPARIVRGMGADIVIAVNLDKHYLNIQWKPGWYDIANDSLRILRHHLALLNSESADITIEINLEKNRWYTFVNGQDKILFGEKATKNILPQLKKLIKEKTISKDKHEIF